MKFTILTTVAAGLFGLSSVIAQPVVTPAALEAAGAETASPLGKRCEGRCAIWCDGMAFGPDERTVRNACRICRAVNWLNGHEGGCHEE
ncbi:hypothetical protein B0T11DRAFT_330097 [Plectosphaerella cucumerina]|uniref:Uncharacterized protein n=1 Tax=Plectosphaerella cucumerina TaxID=40658 RepID=A0A8K0X140_9PEZI|nr:hypothetical protein B0T11DRAFT_330097 [Plectosphaerella cucumerina]